MNVMTARLASVTAPLSKPKPTATREDMAPVADIPRSFFRPMRCTSGVRSRQARTSTVKRDTHVNEDHGRKGHQHVDDRDAQRDVGAKVRKRLGENVVAVVQNCRQEPVSTTRKYILENDVTRPTCVYARELLAKHREANDSERSPELRPHEHLRDGHSRMVLVTFSRT